LFVIKPVPSNSRFLVAFNYQLESSEPLEYRAYSYSIQDVAGLEKQVAVEINQ
jgi:hypothetical protein